MSNQSQDHGPKFHVGEAVRYGLFIVEIKEIIPRRITDKITWYRYLVNYYGNTTKPSFLVEDILLQRIELGDA